MKAFALTLEPDSLERADGAILAADVPKSQGKGFAWRKGHEFTTQDLPRLAESYGAVLHLLQLEPGDLHEETAGLRLANAVSGPGVRVRGFNGSQFDLVAEHRGLLRVDAETLAKVNSLDGISIFTLFDGLPVDEGQELAGVKIVPLAIPEETIESAEALAATVRPLRVYPFRPLRVGALVLRKIDEETRARFRAALELKLQWFGGHLATVLEVENDVAAFARAFRQMAEEQVDVVMAAGAKSLDPLEPLFLAVEDVGARIEKHGVPADPGSLFWMACLPAGERDVPMFGLSSCEMFSHKTVLDLVLPRVFAGEPVGRATLVSLGHGGLLTRDMAFRFPPYGERQKKGSSG